MAAKTVEIRITGDASGAIRALKAVGISAETTGTKASHLGDKITTSTSHIGGAFSRLDEQMAHFGLPFAGVLSTIGGELDKFTVKGEKVGEVFAEVGRTVALAGVVGFAALGTAAVHMADDFETAEANAKTAIKNAGGSYAAFAGQIKVASKAAENLGFNNTQFLEGLAKLTTGLNDPTKALALMGLTQDIAAKQGMSLADAAVLVAKAQEGQLKPLKAAGIDLPIVIGGTKSLAAAQTALAAAERKAADAAKNVGRAQSDLEYVQARINNGSLKGIAASHELAGAQNKLADAQEAATRANADVAASQKNVNDTADAGNQIIKALGERFGGAAKEQAKTFHGELKVLGAQLTDVGIQVGLWLIPKLQALGAVLIDGIHWLKEHKAVAMALAIVIGTVLVAAVVAYTISMIQAAAATIAATWPILAIIAAVALVVTALVLLYTKWDTVWNWIKDNPVIAAVIAIVVGVIAPFLLIAAALVVLAKNWDDVWGWIKQAASDTRDWIVNAFNDVISFFEKLPGRIASAVKSIPGTLIDAFTPHIPGVHLPGLPDLNPFGAAGAVVTRPTHNVTLGDAGPEAVIPLNRMPGAFPLPGGGGSGSTLVFPINIGGRQVAEVVVSELNRAGGPKISQRAIA